MRPSSLYRRIYLHFLLVLIGVGGVSSWIFAGHDQRGYLTEVVEKIIGHTAALLAHAPDAAARNELARQLGHELDLDLALYDDRGQLVAAGGHPPALTSSDPFRAKPHLFHRGRLWLVSTWVTPPGERPLRLLCASARFSSYTFSSRPLLTLLSMLVIVALAVRPLARRISRPVERIIEASRRFGEGDLSTRVRMPQWKHPRWRRRRHRADELFTLMHAWNDMAERIERQVGAQRELLANVSHELRSPLARVRVALALLPEQETTRQRIRDIEADLGELDALIEQILQTSRLEATGLPGHTEAVLVSTLFEEVIGRAAADPVTAPLALSVDPAQPGDVTIDVDRALIRRALFNLVENAAKYAAGPVLLGVERNDGIALVVRDHGPGIPLADRERVLRPFVSGDRAHTPGRGGVGLGLSFVSRVAQVHGGRLELDDAPGYGLVVRLHLPAARVPTC